MSKSNLCPCCQQPLPSQKRGGVYLPPRKAQIFDAIDRYPGISILGIIAKCYNGNGSANAVRVSINQINNLFSEGGTRVRITSKGDLRGCYRVIRSGEMAA
jgi:hypothetical protein